MFTRVAARLPINAAFAAKRAAPAAIRYNSSASSGSAARIVEMASQAERPDAANVAVPALWAVCGVLTYTAWNRMTERRDAGNVEKMLIV